ncbi:MAG: alpha/beta hydrolase [Rhodobacteraceae bacterium]|nr:alpha/beta hydrolase [Paracoccaceae bacterium]
MAVSTLLLSSLFLATGCGVVAKHRETRAEEQFPPEGRFVTLSDGRQVHVVVRGSGPDVVLIHGASGNTRDFTFAFAGQLSDRYRVIVFDRPGMGWSDRAGPEYGGAFNTQAESPAEQAAMLQAAALELGADRPIVLGQSYGGAVALAWALNHPQALSGLVVVSGASNPWPGELDRLYRVNASPLGGATVVPALTAFAPRARADEVLAGIFAPQPVPEGYAEHIGVGLSLRREALRANARQVTSLRPHVVEMSERYPTIGVPTEILHGTADTIVPLEIHSEPLSRQIPGARLTRLDGIGHMPHHVTPEAVFAAIDRVAADAGLR